MPGFRLSPILLLSGDGWRGEDQAHQQKET
jgi:hypothetical protein